MVWTATSIVAADVTDRPAPVVDRDEVESELASGTPGSNTAANSTTPSSTPKVENPTTTVRSRGREPVPAGPSAPVPAAPLPPSPQPGPTIAASPPTTTAPGVPTTRPASPPTTQPPPRPTATYSTSGGVVRVACNDFFFIELLSAIPSNGYAVDVVSRGPGKVEVRFIRSGQDVSVNAFCYGEPIRYYESDSSSQTPRPRP